MSQNTSQFGYRTFGYRSGIAKGMTSKDIKSHVKQVLRQVIDPKTNIFKLSVDNLRKLLYSRVNLRLDDVKERMRSLGLFEIIVDRVRQENLAVGLYKVFEVRAGERLIPVDPRKMRKNIHKKNKSSGNASKNCTGSTSWRSQTHDASKNSTHPATRRSERLHTSNNSTGSTSRISETEDASKNCTRPAPRRSERQHASKNCTGPAYKHQHGWTSNKQGWNNHQTTSTSWDKKQDQVMENVSDNVKAWTSSSTTSSWCTKSLRDNLSTTNLLMYTSNT